MNSEYKTRVSRSLTDLQQSLDEACRRGFPNGHLQNVDTGKYNERDAVQNDLTYKAATANLEQMLDNKNPNIRTNYTHFAPPVKSQFIYGSHDSLPPHCQQYNTNAIVGPRQLYISTLRSLVNQNKPQIMYRSRSCETVDNNRVTDKATRPTKMSNSDLNTIKTQIEHLKVDVDQLSERFFTHKKSSRKNVDHKSGYLDESDESSAIINGLKRRIEGYREREASLIEQLEQMIHTVEQARMEQAGVVLERGKLEAELEGMRGRLKTLVSGNEQRVHDQEEEIRQSIGKEVDYLKKELSSVAKRENSAISELNRLQNIIANQEGDLERIKVELRVSEETRRAKEVESEAALTRMAIQRDEAESVATKHRSIRDQDRVERDRERMSLEDEVRHLRKKWSVANDNQANLVEENIRLLKSNDEMKLYVAQHEQSANKHIRQTEEATAKKISELKKSNRKHEKELSKIRKYYEQILIDADSLMRNQNSLVGRLKGELGSSVQELDGVSDRHREEMSELQWCLTESQNECREMRKENNKLREDVEDFRAHLNESRNRLDELGEKKNQQDQEILELLDTKNRLLKSVELLGAEMLDVRRQMCHCNCGAINEAKKLINERMIDKVLGMGLDNVV